MKLTTLDPIAYYERASRDPAAAFVEMHDRLHRASLVMAMQPGDDPSSGYSLMPEKQGEWWDDGYEGSKLSDADICRRIEAWGRLVPKAEPGEIDEADRTLALLAGMPNARRAYRIVAVRAWQEHHNRESWRRAGRMLGISHELARRLHHDAVEWALLQVLQGANAINRRPVAA